MPYTNPEDKRAHSRRYYAANRVARAAYNKKWQETNPEKVKSNNKNWYEKNKEHAKGRIKKYKSENRRKVNAQRRDSYYKNTNFRLRVTLSNRLRDSMQGLSKAAKTFILLGGSLAEVRGFLEKQFQPGMTWENHGKWHIDHKRPCASFDLSDPKQQKACFHYTNLQPLWAEENLKKGDKYYGVLVPQKT